MKFKTKTVRVEIDLSKAIDKRLKDLKVDFSKYVRQLILSEMLMKSADIHFQKKILNP